MLVRLSDAGKENGKLGNKGKFLLLMKQNGFNVPDGFVLDSDTYDETVKGEPEKVITNTLEGLNKDNQPQRDSCKAPGSFRRDKASC